MLRAICRFSRGVQFVLIYRYARDNQSTESASGERREMYFARRFVDGSTEICFGSDDGDQFGAKLRFSEEHILYIARQSFTLRRARSANRPLLFPLTPEYSANITTFRVVPITFSLHGINIFQL